MYLLSVVYAAVVLYACTCAPFYSGTQDNAAKTDVSLRMNSTPSLSEAGGFIIPNNTTPVVLKQISLRMKRGLRDKSAFDEVDDFMFRELSIHIFNHCSDAQFCKVAPDRGTSEADKYDRCCFECTCDINCARTGTCCPDIQTINDKEYEYVVQTDKDVECKPAQFDTSGYARSLSYRFVVSCPDHTDLEARERCAHPGTLGVDTAHVFDTVGQLNYQNRFCAACHGVPNERLVWWTWIIRYRHQNVSTIEHRKTSADDELERDDLEIELHPPEVEGANLTICYNDVIDTCNITGNWTHYNANIYQGCKYLQLFHGDYVSAPIRYFKNIFCAMCNGVDTLVINCPYGTSPISVDVGFQYMVSHTLSDTNAPGDKRVCARRYEFDPLSGRCRRFHCTFPTLADDIETKCQDIGFIIRSLYSVPVLMQFGDFIDASQAEVIGIATWDHVTRNAPAQVGIEQMEMHFETEMSFVDLRRHVLENGINRKYIKVKEFMINIIVLEYYGGIRLDRPSNHYYEFKEKLHATDFNIFLPLQDNVQHAITARLRHLNMDAWNLFPPNNSYVIRVANTNDGSVQYIYDNFYSGNAMLGLTIPRLPGLPPVDRDVTFAYSKNFIGCPSFVYELEDYGFTRTPLGLMINGSDPLMFNFSEFTSINKTHARICVESVQQKIPVSSGNVVSMVITNTMILVALLDAFSYV